MAIHDLTFTDWEHYTDGDGNSHTLDWTIANMVGSPPYPYLEAIRQALNERFAVSRVELTTSPTYYDIPIDKVSEPRLGVFWMQKILREVMSYLWVDRYFLDYEQWYDYRFFQWISPSTPTMNNIQKTFYENMDGLCYCGSVYTAENTITYLTRAEVRTAMLDDAGISSTALRDWWLSFDTAADIYDIYGSIYNSPPFLMPSSDIIWSMKRMLNLLTESFEMRPCKRYPGQPFVSAVLGEYKSGSDRKDYLSEAEMTAAEIAASLARAAANLNSASWVTDSPAVAFPSHLGARDVHVEDGREKYYISTSLSRERVQYDITMLGDVSRAVKLYDVVALRDIYGYWYYNGRPIFRPTDFAGITGVPTGVQPNVNEDGWVYSLNSSGTYGIGDVSITIGDFPTSTMDFPATTGSYSQVGWRVQEIGIRQNFNVTNGFTFR